MKRLLVPVTILVLLAMACDLTPPPAPTWTAMPANPTAERPLPPRPTPPSPGGPTRPPRPQPPLPPSPASPSASGGPAWTAGDSPNTYWVTNPTSGARLYVEVVRPQKPTGQKSPALVLIPGGIGASDNFKQGAQGPATVIAEAGFIVVIFDPDGRGKSGGSENYDGLAHQDGLAAIIRFTAALPDIDAKQIGLVSYSYGITMASGVLARYPDLPIRFLIDWEGPADRNYTTTGCRENKGVIPWPSCSDNAFWAEREAVTFIAKIRVPYQRIQSEKDHVQPNVAHAIDMVNAAMRGGVPWVRLNDQAPNQTFDPKAPPAMIPESAERPLEQHVIKYAQELGKLP